MKGGTEVEWQCGTPLNYIMALLQPEEQPSQGIW